MTLTTTTTIKNYTYRKPLKVNNQELTKIYNEKEKHTEHYISCMLLKLHFKEDHISQKLAIFYRLNVRY